MQKHILVTGGAGYIGSHTCIELLESNHQVTVIDNLINSKAEALHRVSEITGKTLEFIKLDLLNKESLEKVFETHSFDSVIHFAGLKAVGESVAKPLWYYQNNLISTMNLLDCMKKYAVSEFVFSSSATVYGDPASVPITEDFPLQATNPYGRTKLMIEDMLRDFVKANPEFRMALLRYFNPVGAHKSGKIGEDPNGIPNNLIPFIAQVAVGKLEKLRVFGNDYPTPDGTGVRDYIHVVDLAKGHVKALENIENISGALPINLGTGQGFSVLQMVKAFSKASGIEIPYEIVDRRPGDIASCYAKPDFAEEIINWKAEKTIDEMCEDTWRWQSANPNGFPD